MVLNKFVTLYLMSLLIVPITMFGTGSGDCVDEKESPLNIINGINMIQTDGNGFMEEEPIHLVTIAEFDVAVAKAKLSGTDYRLELPKGSYIKEQEYFTFKEDFLNKGIKINGGGAIIEAQSVAPLSGVMAFGLTRKNNGVGFKPTMTVSGKVDIKHHSESANYDVMIDTVSFDSEKNIKRGKNGNISIPVSLTGIGHTQRIGDTEIEINSVTGLSVKKVYSCLGRDLKIGANINFKTYQLNAAEKQNRKEILDRVNTVHENIHNKVSSVCATGNALYKSTQNSFIDFANEMLSNCFRHPLPYYPGSGGFTCQSKINPIYERASQAFEKSGSTATYQGGNSILFNAASQNIGSGLGATGKYFK